MNYVYLYMNYHYNDGGRSTSKRPKQTNDCSVRAVAISFDLPYDVAYDVLAKHGRECSQGMHRKSFIVALKRLSEMTSKEVINHSFPAVKGESRMNTERFVNRFNKGRFILNQAGHYSAVVDGVSEDTFETDERCVYSAWEIK